MKTLILFIIVAFSFTSCDPLLTSVLNSGPLTTTEVGNGLKEALKQGITKGSTQASKVDGYFGNALLKILVPPEMQKVEQKLRSLGFNKLMDDFTLSLNRGAEEAAKTARPIFVDAITAMTIPDAWNILKGSDDAATMYLKNNTGQKLYTAFKPVIQNALQKVNATKYYKDVINTYNQIPFVTQVNPDLEDYVTNKAIDGLFLLIKKEEVNIRNNASARVNEILKKVFTEANMGRK